MKKLTIKGKKKLACLFGVIGIICLISQIVSPVTHLAGVMIFWFVLALVFYESYKNDLKKQAKRSKENESR